MDPLGMAPVTTTMAPEKLSYVAMKFKKMCAEIIQLKKKYDFKVVVGGNGAWELAKSDRMKVHGIDTVVVGEADELALDLFHDLEKGDAPELMHCFVKNIQNIPEITKPTVNSLIEAIRTFANSSKFFVPEPYPTESILISTKNSLHEETKLTKILAPVGVVNSSFTGPPLTIIFEFLKISVIAYAGFDVVP